MKHTARPTQITTFLKTIAARIPAESSAELESYIADLEARQPDRPDRIAAILQNIDSQYSVEGGTSLEAYISNLEARQQVVPSNNSLVSPMDSNRPPIWSHLRVVERENRRRKHALRKQNDHR